MNWTFTRNSAPTTRSRMACMRLKMVVITRGMMPTCSSMVPARLPLPIVYVLPDPVCPYASTVAL